MMLLICITSSQLVKDMFSSIWISSITKRSHLLYRLYSGLAAFSQWCHSIKYILTMMVVVVLMTIMMMMMMTLTY